MIVSAATERKVVGGTASLAKGPLPDELDSSEQSPTLLDWFQQRPSWGWFVVGTMILAQFLLFRQFIRREIVWFAPLYHDQGGYLAEVYGLHETMLNNGFVNGIRKGVFHEEPHGILFQLQGAILCLFFGPGREVMLTFGFVMFAVFQLALVATLRWASGRWSIALLGFGLLLACLTAHQPYGSVTDFRIDFYIYSLYGIFLCALIRSDYFRFRSWSFAAGAVACVLTLSRFITVVYFAGIMAVVLPILLFRYFRDRSRPGLCENLGRQLRHLIQVGVIYACVVLPVLWYNAPKLKRYYIDNHVTGRDKDLRAAQVNVFSRLDHVSYYARSLYHEHAGRWFLVLGGMTFGVFCAFRLLRSKTESPTTSGSSWLFLLPALAIPLAVLTLNVSKSQVVGSILVPPLLLLIVSPLLLSSRPLRLPPWSNKLLAGLAFSALFLGSAVQVRGYCRHTFWHQHREDAQRYLELLDEVERYCVDNALSEPVLSIDRMQDLLSNRTLTTTIYERHGVYLKIGKGLGRNIWEINEADVNSYLGRSDVVILHSDHFSEPSVYPFDETAHKLRPQIRKYCEEHFLLLKQVPFLDDSLSLYVRPTLKMSASEDGWITGSGLRLEGNRSILSHFSQLRLTGEINMSYLQGVAPKPKAYVIGKDGSSEIPAVLNVKDSQYELSIELKPERLPAERQVVLRVEFDRFFVPHELTRSGDTRKLVMRKPSAFTFKR